MTDDRLKWIRGPLPPLSESIVSSGLVSESSLQQPVSQTQQQVFGSSPVSVPSKKKKSVKTPLVENKPKKEKNKFSTPPTNSINSNPSAVPQSPIMNLPSPELPQKYKSPTVEQIFDQTRSKSSFSKPPIIGEPKKISVRTEIIQISHSLDSSIAEIAPTAASLTPSDQADLMSKMLQLYNFHFNQVMLVEKDNNSDLALLLRRFQQFYNQIICDIPNLEETFNIQIEDLQKQIQELKEQLEEEQTLRKIAENKNIEHEKTIENLNQTIKDLTKQSQDKDIQIQNIIDEKELDKIKTNQLNFKINNLHDEIESLKKAIQQRDDEIQRQMELNESSMRNLEQLQHGEAGYIVVYHEEKVKREKAEEQIKELQLQIHNLMNIPKSDKSVDTSDIPQAKTKKKKGTKNENLNGTLTDNISPFASSSKILSNSPQLTPLNSTSNLGSIALSKTENEIHVVHESKEIQTNLLNQPDGQAPCDAGTGFVSVESQTDEIPKEAEISIKEKDKDDDDDEFEGKQLFLLNTTTGDKNENENVDCDSIENKNFVDQPSNEILKTIPDILTTMTPLLSQLYLRTDSQKLEIFDISHLSPPIQNPKPLIWGLQLVHNFLTDSYLRSIQNRSKISIEQVFVDWLKQQYKLQHLVNQVISDFSYLLKLNSEDSIMKLFLEILESRYTFPQVCYIATIYSFSVSLTKPSFLEMLQGISPKTNELKIHIRIAFELISKSLNSKIANNFLSNRATTENPYIDYVDFLRESAYLFGEKHELLHNQAKNLMKICGCSDLQNIQNDSFSAFFCFLGITNPKEIKKDWKFVQTDDSTTIQKVISLCADKKKPLMNLLAFNSLATTVKKMSTLPPLLLTVFDSFIKRYTMTVPGFMKDSINVQNELKNDMEEVKNSLINVDIPKILWFYKKFLLKFDELCLNEKGFIPLATTPNDQMIKALIEYYDRAETVSFAFVNV